MTAAAALAAAVRQLASAGVADAPRDARRLMAHAMGVDPVRLTLHLTDPLDSGAAARFAEGVAARLRRQPVSQITGQRLFFGRPFRVTPDVLDPRPETEVLVAAALEHPFAHVLDLGTGSGAILLTLLGERPAATGLGTDVSPAALAVAEHNARSLALGARAEFRAGDWWQAVPAAARFDLMVSNPPYIAEVEMAGLAPEVRDWEPRMALTPGGDGLDAFRAVAAGAAAHLAPGGRLLLEIGATQGPAVRRILISEGFAGPCVLPDLDGRDRVVTVRMSPDKGGTGTET